MRRRPTDYLCVTGVLVFLIATVILLPVLGRVWSSTIYHASLLIAIVMPVALSALSYFMSSKALKPIHYLPALLGLAAISLAVFHAANPSLLHSMRGSFGILSPSISTTILEAYHLLFPYGHFSLEIAWLNFTTSFFISFSQSCFRAHSRRLIDAINITENGFGFSVQVLIQARRKGFTIKEVPISCLYHPQGSSLNPVIHGLGVAFTVIKLRLLSH